MDRPDELSRREFLVKSTVTAAAMTLPSFAFSQGSDQIKVGLIGAGGRGTDACMNATEADPAVVIWSIADVFPDHMDSCKKNLSDRLKDRFKATDDRCFLGFDAYQKVLASGVDYVILTTPPAFRPYHLRAAVEANKHVFMEKPVATDAPGIRSVMESADMAQQKKLTIVAGTQRRHDLAYNEAMKRIHGGEMGEVNALYAYWNQGGLWMNPRQPGWSDLEWQMRNWLYFTWLSGDHIAEQHIHNMDVCNWAMQQHPVKATCLGGRQVRTDPAYGQIFDHFATEFEYANGVKMLSMCRQIDGTASRVSEEIVGSKGRSNGNTYIRGDNAWRWEGDRPNPYMLEHRDLIKSMRNGDAFNEGRQVAESTMTAIMGRMAAYSGQEVKWEDALKSEVSLFPNKLEFGPMPVAAVPMPGTTKPW